MPNNLYTGMLIYVVVSLVFITTITYLLIKCKNKDKFCTCQGMDKKQNVNIQNLKTHYDSGKLTEFSKFKNKKWSKNTI